MNSEVKQRKARLVPRWGTARENLRVLSAFDARVGLSRRPETDSCALLTSKDTRAFQCADTNCGVRGPLWFSCLPGLRGSILSTQRMHGDFLSRNTVLGWDLRMRGFPWNSPWAGRLRASSLVGTRESTLVITVAILAQGTTSGDALCAALFCVPWVQSRPLSLLEKGPNPDLDHPSDIPLR